MTSGEPTMSSGSSPEHHPKHQKIPAQPKSRSKPDPPRLCIEIDPPGGHGKTHLSPQPPAPSFSFSLPLSLDIH